MSFSYKRTKTIKVSVVIPIHNDPKIEESINHIKSRRYKVEIIVVLNAPDSKTLELLDKISMHNRAIKTVFTTKKSIGRARDLGCMTAKGKFLVMMDSDCIMKNGSLDRLIGGLSNADLSKGSIKYLSTNFSTRLVAKVRASHLSASDNLYTPMLAFRKEIVKKIGGYYFSHSLQWSEDSEFAERAKNAKLTFKKIPSAIAYHEPTTIKRDMEAAFRYGFGFGTAVRRGIRYGDPVHGRGKNIIDGVKSDIFGFKERIIYIKNIFEQHGVEIGIYRVIWMTFYQLGRYFSYVSKNL